MGSEEKQSLADVSKKIRAVGMEDEKPADSEGAPKPGASETVAEPPAPKPKTPEEMKQDPGKLLERDIDVYKAYAAPEKKDEDPFRRAEDVQNAQLKGRGGLPDELSSPDMVARITTRQRGGGIWEAMIHTRVNGNPGREWTIQAGSREHAIKNAMTAARQHGFDPEMHPSEK